MPCRPKLCQRVAAQLSRSTTSANGSHIWISDDLLSEAFSRYLRVSHASRRYGSHVPGPLEARKRSTKRRMGMAAVSVGGGLPPDFGASFGAGGRTGWKWEAPTLNIGKSPPLPPPPLRRRSAISDSTLREPEAGFQPDPDTGVLDEEVDPVQVSREAFHQLLEGVVLFTKDQKFDLVFDFLVSSADEMEARNMAQLLRWLQARQGRDVTPATLRRLFDLICDKRRLQTLPHSEFLEVLTVLPNLVPWRTDEALAQEMHSMYEHFWKLDERTESSSKFCYAFLEVLRPTARDPEDFALVLAVLDHGLTHAEAKKANALLQKNIPAILETIASYPVGSEDRALAVATLTELLTKSNLKPITLKRCTEGYLGVITDKSQQKEATLVWLQCLHACQRAYSAVNGAYSVLATHFQPRDLAEHFATLPTIDFARMLLRAWLPNVSINTFAQDQWRQDHKYLVDQPLLDQVDFSTTILPSLAEEFEALAAERAENEDGESFQNHPLRWLIYVFARKDLQYDALTEAILSTCIAAYDPHRLHNTFSALWLCNSIRLKTSAIVPIIEHFLAIGEASRALNIVNRVPSITPETYPEIYVKLITAGILPKKRAFRALHRARGWVPYRKRRVYKLAITDSQVDAVHLMAYAYASALDNIRIAFRSVWACYRYLQDRGAQLSPLLSRALVHAGVTRPLQARVWVPDERLAFILRLVKRIEGEKVGLQLEEVANKTREGIHDQVLQKRRAEAGHVVRFERKAAMFRLKSWAKLKEAEGEDLEHDVVQDAFTSSTSSGAALEENARPSTDLGHYTPFASGEQDLEREVVTVKHPSTTRGTASEQHAQPSTDLGYYTPFASDEQDLEREVVTVKHPSTTRGTASEDNAQPSTDLEYYTPFASGEQNLPRSGDKT